MNNNNTHHSYSTQHNNNNTMKAFVTNKLTKTGALWKNDAHYSTYDPNNHNHKLFVANSVVHTSLPYFKQGTIHSQQLNRHPHMNNCICIHRSTTEGFSEYTWCPIENITKVILPTTPSPSERTYAKLLQTPGGYSYRLRKNIPFPWLFSNSEALKKGVLNEYGVPQTWMRPIQYAQSIQNGRVFRNVLSFLPSEDFSSVALVNKYFHRNLMDVPTLTRLFRARSYAVQKMSNSYETRNKRTLTQPVSNTHLPLPTILLV